MRLKKVSLRWIASMLATLLVFLQLATAAYACAAPQTAVGESAMAAMPDCEAMASMDAEQPQLCKAHCDRDKQTVNNAPVADVAPVALLDPLLTRLALWLPPEAAEALPALVAAHTGPPDGAPPVYLALQVFRI
ncbi:MAG: hypothetical protein ACT6S0_21000 [Roseateles sp.]|uniref:hypothetical protein n=1 Tax=Roseateles sp. TaxID=1971397 RepID=UPI0040366401